MQFGKPASPVLHGTRPEYPHLSTAVFRVQRRPNMIMNVIVDHRVAEDLLTEFGRKV
jgi:hypothetical protein